MPRDQRPVGLSKVTTCLIAAATPTKLSSLKWRTSEKRVHVRGGRRACRGGHRSTPPVHRPQPRRQHRNSFGRNFSFCTLPHQSMTQAAASGRRPQQASGDGIQRLRDASVHVAVGRAFRGIGPIGLERLHMTRQRIADGQRLGWRPRGLPLRPEPDLFGLEPCPACSPPCSRRAVWELERAQSPRQSADTPPLRTRNPATREDGFSCGDSVRLGHAKALD